MSNQTDGEAAKRDIAQAERKIFEGFLNVLQNKADQISTREDNFRLEEKERNLLLKINNMGLLEGALAGVVSLVLLRRTRAQFFKRFQQMRNSAMNQQQSGPVPNSPFHQQMQSPTMTHAFSRPSPIQSLFGWMLDGMVSLSVAASVGFFFLDASKAMENFAKVPLLPGYSRVSDEFCPEIIAEWERLVREASVKENATEHKLSIQEEEQLVLPRVPPVTPFLAAIVKFRANCVRRQGYERNLRKERGYSSDHRVEIPEPGVPETEEALEGDWESGEAFYEPSTEEQLWADDMTSDQDPRRDY